MLLAGTVVVLAAAFVSGTTGLGYGLVATPLLLALGFAIPFVVVVNLTIALVTRIPVAYQLRASVDRRRSALLIAGSIPGLYIGARLLARVDPAVLEIALGSLVMASVVLLVLRAGSPTPAPRTGSVAPALAGLAGGVLATLGSLNGLVPALLLARDRVPPLGFVADLAVYFVVSNAIGLALLGATGALDTTSVFPELLAWLPAAVIASQLGVRLMPRIPTERFRHTVLVVVFVAGAMTVAAGVGA